ncbi:MAG: hypothetical protein U0936_17760 [Planctomycetaceae bacterium]
MFHVSVGIWLGAPSALLTIGIIVFSHEYLQVPLDMARANRTLLSLFSAIGIAAILGGLASLMALWKGVRVWVNPHFFEPLRKNKQAVTFALTMASL